MATNSTQPSELVQALNKLNETPAIPIRDDTAVPMPTPRFVVNHRLADHIARSKESFAFVPQLDPTQTYSIFQSAKEAWQHDKLPVLAVCGYSKSPFPFQKATGIQADTADQFLSDLNLAHRMVPTLGASPAYIIRHYHSPNDKYDDVILPAHANLIVYEAHALSHIQLATLFEHVANVGGKIILCGDHSEFANFHPELSEAAERSIAQAVPSEWRHLVEPSSPAAEELGNSLNLLPSENTSPQVGNSEPKHPEQLPLFDLPPSRTPYLIYHSRPGNTAEFPLGFDVVAKVYAENIQSAIASAQNLDAPKTDNPGVVTFTHKPRPTQPGDVICHNDVVKRLEVADFETLKRAERPQNRPEQPKQAPDDLEPEPVEPKRPRPKIKP
jgi:hypothetical protein